MKTKTKTKVFTMRLSQEEKDLIKERAEWYHQTVSNYLLTLALQEARRNAAAGTEGQENEG